MIQARIHKRFAAAGDSAGFALDVEFQAAAGITVLFGPGGAGKTLVLDSIAGFLTPQEGRILLDDQILFDAAARVNLPPQQRRCGYLFESCALFPHMSLRRNLEFAAACPTRGRRPRMERHRRVKEMIARFRLAEASGLRPHEASGGERLRCSVARALVGEPRLLLLDAPARGSDAPLRAEWYAVLRQVREEFRVPLLLATHDLEECLELGEEMLVVREGRLVQSGAPGKILDQPANLEVARLLGLYNLLEVQITALDPANPEPYSSIARTYAGAGQFGKAAQYAEQAVSWNMLDPRLHGLLGVMYYHNNQFEKALPELNLAIAGGTTDQGPVAGIPLDRGTIGEYYWTYGLALAKLDRCDEAVPLFRLVLAGIPDDDLAAANATEGLVLCKEISPTATPKPSS